MEERANELIESWINGNRSWVVGEIVRQPSKAKAAALAALVTAGLDEAHRPGFVRRFADNV